MVIAIFDAYQGICVLWILAIPAFVDPLRQNSGLTTDALTVSSRFSNLAQKFVKFFASAVLDDVTTVWSCLPNCFVGRPGSLCLKRWKRVRKISYQWKLWSEIWFPWLLLYNKNGSQAFCKITYSYHWSESISDSFESGFQNYILYKKSSNKP